MQVSKMELKITPKSIVGRTFQYKGNQYRVQSDTARQKDSETGEWVDAVIYNAVENSVSVSNVSYVREKNQFLNRFKPTVLEEGDYIVAICMGKILGIYKLGLEFKAYSISDVANTIQLHGLQVAPNGAVNVQLPKRLEHFGSQIEFYWETESWLMAKKKELEEGETYVDIQNQLERLFRDNPDSLQRVRKFLDVEFATLKANRI